ncbi:MAG TPA: hypothetical protein VFP50_09260 [Anaeromyxobacteraceae bacterium]|nr:hypothetical protein [Anaeromyxobacteraceae bacterium]
MPLFRRADGDLVRDEAPVRRIMPYLMRGRNESAVYHESIYRIAAARAWLKAYNRTHPHRATLFHLLAYAVGVALHRKPRLNRFVSGGRLYQRRGVQLSFVAKREMTETGADATVKLEVPAAEPFSAFSARLAHDVEQARTTDRAVDREVALVLLLPGPLVAAAVALVRALDRWNLLPAFMTRDDPMYASLFLANLGSAGVSDAWHHLFEYGTVSIFGAMSAPRRTVFAGRGGAEVEEALGVRWTFDERIDDAFSSSRALAIVQRIMEDPARHLGPPEGEAPAWRPSVGVVADP